MAGLKPIGTIQINGMYDDRALPVANASMFAPNSPMTITMASRRFLFWYVSLGRFVGIVDEVRDAGFNSVTLAPKSMKFVSSPWYERLAYWLAMPVWSRRES